MKMPGLHSPKAMKTYATIGLTTATVSAVATSLSFAVPRSPVEIMAALAVALAYTTAALLIGLRVWRIIDE